MNVREWALPVYTILTELATGALILLWIVRGLAAQRFERQQVDRAVDNSIFVVFITVTVGMLGAHFHLSKPHLSFLALLNIRTSWLSREIALTLLFVLIIGWLWALQRRSSVHWGLKTVLGWAAIVIGIANLYCMSRIYFLPTQTAWNTPVTVISFFASALLLGAMSLSALLVMDLKYSEMRHLDKAQVLSWMIPRFLPWFAACAVLLSAMLVVENISQVLSLGGSSQHTATATVSLLLNLYPLLFGMRLLLVVLGVGGLAGVLFWQARRSKSISELLVPTYLTCLLVMIGEILGRFLFYATHVRIGI